MTSTAYDYRQLAPGRMYLSGGGRDFGGAFRGVDPEQVRTTDELLAETGLDWGVMQRPVYTRDPWGQLVEIENRVANIRDDNGYPLGVVGKGYRPLVNRDGLGFADALVQNGEGGWIGAVESGGGAKVSALMRLDRDIRIAGMDDERFLPLLMFRNGHDGGTGVSVAVAPFRCACLNGMMLPIRGAQRVWRYRHSTNINKRIDEARRALELSWSYYDELERLGDQLVHTPMIDGAFGRFLDRLVPLDPKIEPDSRPAKNREAALAAIRQLYYHSPTLDAVTGTAWAALNAVTEYNCWERRTRGGKNEARKAEYRFERATSPQPLADRALALLTEDAA
jgi:phage/plasmid-like protein (TIGR03299 family)